MMIDSTFLAVIDDIIVKTDLGDGLEINANEKNSNFPTIKITNNADVIRGLLNPALGKLIGLIEFRNFLKPNILVAYSHSQFDEGKINSIQHLDLNLSLLKMYFYCLWMTKDNSADFDLGFLYFQNLNDEFEASSNVFSNTNFSCIGNNQTVEFSVEELKLSSLFLKENIVIDNSRRKIVNTTTYNRITIANYFIQNARTCRDLGLKITSYCSALETLFSNDSTELSHKLAERVAHFLSTNKTERLITFKLIKKAYELRSKIVHGATIRESKTDGLEPLLIDIDNICRQIMKHSFTKDDKENVFVWPNEKHEDFFLDLIMT